MAIASPTRSVVRARTTVGHVRRRGGGRPAARPTRIDGAGRREQAVRPHPLVVVELGQVAPAAVGQEDDDDRVAAAVGRGSARAPPRARRRAPSRTSSPARIPSSRVSRRAIANASRSQTRTQRSTTAGSYVPGKKSSPTPSVRYGRAVSPDRTLPSGSAPMIRIAGFCALQVVGRRRRSCRPSRRWPRSG